MSKARDLADFISTGAGTGILADGAIDTTEITGVTVSSTEINRLAGVGADVQTQINAKAATSSLAAVATSGAYSDLSGSPSGDSLLPSQSGNADKFLTTNGSASSWTEIASGGSADFVASGAIANGEVVILNSNGTVSSGAPTSTSVSSSMGSQTLYLNSSNIEIYSTVHDATANKVLFAYREYANSTNTAYIVAGTLSGTSITWGTPVTYLSGAMASSTQLLYDDTTGKVLIAFSDGSDGYKGATIIATLSGTSISLGTKQTWSSARINDTRLVKDTQNNKIIMTYADEGGNSNHGTARVGTISGSSISFGAATVFEASYMSSAESTLAYDSSNNKVLICYQDWSASDCKGIVGSVSSNTISFGSPTTFNSARSPVTALVFDTSVNKFVCIYADNNNSGYGTAIVATISGNSVSFGTPAVFNSASSHPSFASYDSNVNKTFLMWAASNVVGRYAEISVSGTTPSFSTTQELISGYVSSPMRSAFDTTSGKTILFYEDVNSDVYYRVYQVGGTATVNNVTNSNVIGVAAAAISDTATGSITVNGGINEGQSSLAVGTTYYVADNGTLQTTNNGRKIGKAISATKLLVNSNMSGDEMNAYLGGLV